VGRYFELKSKHRRRDFLIVNQIDRSSWARPVIDPVGIEI
jgi:hypothetical protein